MRNEGFFSLGWPRKLGLAFIVATGLCTIVGTGGGGPPPPQPQVIGIDGGPIMTADGQTIGHIPQFAHNGTFTVTATVKSGQLTVDRTPNSEGATIVPGFPITLTLPPGPDGLGFIPIPNQPCPAPDPIPSLRHCWNIISPGFFGSTGDPKTPEHRLSKNELKTSDIHAVLKIDYGAQLQSSEPQPPKLDGVSLPNRVPVLFIHGYQLAETLVFGKPILGGKWGGGIGTWDSLLDLPRVGGLKGTGAFAGDSFLTFEFRWRTDASFVTVANDLAKAISEIHTATGQRVHIVAHSFGGVLARTLLQDIDDATKGPASWSVASKVRSLTTVGTPHSGTLHQAGSVEAALLPSGWNPPALDSIAFCLQISCYQAGINTEGAFGDVSGLADFARYDLMGNSQTLPSLGYISARLKNGIGQASTQSGTAIPILSLIGQSVGPVVINGVAGVNAFLDGDGLISYRGQRFKHLDSDIREDLSLMFESATNYGFVVTERILGLEAGVNALPYDPVSVVTRTPYSAALDDGYWHTTLLHDAELLVHPLKLSDVFAPEVSIGTDLDFSKICASCIHDTWVNIKQFLLSMHGGPASSNFPTATGPTGSLAQVCQLSARFPTSSAANPHGCWVSLQK